ncbi:hypothetical protein [Paenibacillus xylaniclasticus]|uniref:hypothetical protein n=1 Tax=Paenibacillus xylaniclasticus TaxID=588083 RepID=UPI000FDB4E21|nr:MULTISPECIES: hypothetical protein [Paenibacillus]GFN30760.1 hypothetical protein PCURB6_10200 [Paenibacillus curdlanolyticus]
MSRTAALCILIISQFIYVLLLVVWLVMTAMSAMLFDSPQAERQAAPWLILVYILLYPVGVIVSIVLGWVKFASGQYKQLLIWNAIPLIWIVPFVVLMVYAFS